MQCHRHSREEALFPEKHFSDSSRGKESANGDLRGFFTGIQADFRFDFVSNPNYFPPMASPLRLAFLLPLLWLGNPHASQATIKDDIGYTRLVNELTAAGKPIPDGAGVTLSQAEAEDGGVSGKYVPNPTRYPGVTLVNRSELALPSTISGHANGVADVIYGSSGLASGITNVDLYYAGHWLGGGMLRGGFPDAPPLLETTDISNHSWVGNGSTTAESLALLNRLDISAAIGGHLPIVGVNNGSSGRYLLGGAYNIISVGVSSGNHKGPPGSLNPGVTGPHIVVPTSFTSFATPYVTGAAAMLIQTARQYTPGDATNADRPEVIKAALLAGATQREFPGWSHTETAPLDATFGAGELNIANSYHILTGGKQTASPTLPVAATGWDYQSLSLGEAVGYRLELALPGAFQAALTWLNIPVPTDNYDTYDQNLANLNLFLYRIGEGDALDLVAQSIAPAGNVEFLTLPTLESGSYLLSLGYPSNAVGTRLDEIPYALAWRTAMVPEPSTWALLLAGGGWILLWRLRRMKRAASKGAQATFASVSTAAPGWSQP